MKSRRYERQSIDAPVELEYALEPVRFDTVEQVLSMLHTLVEMGYLSIKKVSSQNYEFECVGDKQNLYKLFPIDIYGNTYFRPYIDDQINDQNTGLLNAVKLKLKNSKEGVPAVRYRDHIPELEYDELTVDTLLSATFLNRMNPKLEDEKTANTTPRLVNIIRPTYTRISDKYKKQVEIEKLQRSNMSEEQKAKLPPLSISQSLIKVLFPCGTSSANVTDRMLDYDQLPNKATQTLIALYYQQRFARLQELRQSTPATPEESISNQQTIKEIEHERAEVEDALERLIEKLQKQQTKFRGMQPHIDAAIKKEFPYAFLALENVKRKLLQKQRTTKRMTAPVLPFYLLASILAIPVDGIGLGGLFDVIKHSPNAKRNMQYAMMLHEYRRIAAHNGHGVIPHIPKDAQEQRSDELRQALFLAKINEKRKSPKYRAASQLPFTFDENAYVHFADIDGGFTQRIRELQTYLTYIQSLASVNGTELTRVSGNPASLNFHPGTSQSLSGDNTLVRYTPPQKK